MENVEVSNDLRVSQEDFDRAQRRITAQEPRRITELLAAKPDAENCGVTAKRIYRFRAE